MEIELDRRLFYGIVVLLALLALAGLALLGRPHTPNPPRIIGWIDWTTLKTEEQYDEELAQLRQDLSTLVQTLQSRPDPVQAELAATRIAQQHADGLALLARQRDAVIIAAEVVRDWAAGYVSYEDAVATVNEATIIVGTDTASLEPTDDSEDNDQTQPWWSDDD